MSKTQTKLEEKELTLKWIDATDKIIKFEGMDKHMTISSDVAQFDWEKAGVTNGTLVSVKINPDTQEVFFMTKSKNNTSEIKVEPKTGSDTNTQQKTVGRISTKNKGITFTEEDGVWYSFEDENMVKGLQKGDLVDIVVSDKKNRNNWILTSIIKIETKKMEETISDVKTSNSKNIVVTCVGSASSSNKEDYVPEQINDKDLFYKYKTAQNYIERLEKDKKNSIEAQGARNVAFELVSASLQGQAPDVLIKNKENIKTLITELAKYAYELVTDLQK